MYPVTKFIQQFIPTARLVEEIGSDIVFILPSEGGRDNAMKSFESLFTELDKNLKKLQISTYGLSDTTLEEVSGVVQSVQISNSEGEAYNFKIFFVKPNT